MRFVDETLRAQASTADGPRQAALMLYSMPRGDRDWLLAQLNVDQRGAMDALLKELCSLGIPPGRGFVEPGEATMNSVNPPVVQEVAEKDSVSFVPIMQAAYSEVLNANLDALARVVAAEPARLTALLLRTHDWPWHENLLTRVDVVKRRQIEAILAELTPDHFVGVPPKLADALIADVAVLVSTAARAQVPAPQRSGWLSRARRALGNK